jgi:hypothetical protein
LVYSGFVGQSKGKYFAFICSVIGLKHNKVLRSRVYFNLVKGLIDIKLCKDLSPIYLGQCFF